MRRFTFVNRIEFGMTIHNFAPARHPGEEVVSQCHFRHSVQAKRDTESRIFNKFWIPAFAGMTTSAGFCAITTQSRKPGARVFALYKKLYVYIIMRLLILDTSPNYGLLKIERQ
jgi:hypothetical protein